MCTLTSIQLGEHYNCYKVCSLCKTASANQKGCDQLGREFNSMGIIVVRMHGTRAVMTSVQQTLKENVRVIVYVHSVTTIVHLRYLTMSVTLCVLLFITF